MFGIIRQVVSFIRVIDQVEKKRYLPGAPRPVA
jgi:hypothetical protein